MSLNAYQLAYYSGMGLADEQIRLLGEAATTRNRMTLLAGFFGIEPPSETAVPDERVASLDERFDELWGKES